MCLFWGRIKNKKERMNIDMPRNKLTDLNNHLFEQLERLNDEELCDEALEKEIKRSKAISSLANSIIQNATLALEAQQYINEYSGHASVPEMIGLETKNER